MRLFCLLISFVCLFAIVGCEKNDNNPIAPAPNPNPTFSFEVRLQSQPTMKGEFILYKKLKVMDIQLEGMNFYNIPYSEFASGGALGKGTGINDSPNISFALSLGEMKWYFWSDKVYWSKDGTILGYSGNCSRYTRSEYSGGYTVWTLVDSGVWSADKK